MKIKIAAAILLAGSLMYWACGAESLIVASSEQETPRQTTASGELHYKAPEGWVTEHPSSSMRVAQYKLPKAEGDREDASLVLYYFGATQGGSAQANIDRWISQIQQPDGGSSKEKAKTETINVNGLKVTTVDVAGTYTA